MSEKKLLLNEQDIELKIQRLSYEVAERYFDKKELYIFGIKEQGYKLAERIIKELQTLSDCKLYLHSISVNKQNPIGSIHTDIQNLNQLKNKDILIIDDVLNSGKTLFYALQPFIQVPIASLKVLVLVNRSHQQFPVYPEFVGTTLSTTYQNHIEADLKNKKQSKVYLLNK
ncbi:MAG: phosphoribosyltransferase domain-containing protein [Bacteroidia bacterium]